MLDLLLNVLIQQYFTSNCLLVISDSNTANLPRGVVMVQSNSPNLFQTVFHNFGCQNFLFLGVKNATDTLLKVEGKLPKIRESFHGRKYLIIEEGEGGVEWLKDVDCLIELVLTRVTLDAKQAIFYATSCEHPKQVAIIDHWFSMNQTFFFDRGLFLGRLRNVHRHAIRVGTFNYRPFAIIDRKNFYFSGTDIRILRTIGRTINASIELSLNKFLWGKPFGNGTTVGVEGEVYDGVLDVGAAGFYLDATALDFFDPTVAYLSIEVTCLVPAPKLLAPWLSPYYAFSPLTWAFLLAAYSLLAVTLYFMISINLPSSIRRTDPIGEAVLTVGTLVIQQSMPQRRYQHKILLTPAMLAIVTINAAYNAGYATVMTKPLYEDAINTLQEFMESDIIWGGTGFGEWITIWKTKGEGLYKRAGQRYRTSTAAQLRKISLMRRNNFAFLADRISGQTHVESFIKDDVIDHYRVMKEAIHTEPICMITRRNFVLLPVMNEIISRLTQSGIVSYWSREYFGHEEYLMRRKVQLAGTEPQRETVILRVSHLLGAFWVWLIGNSLALAVFAFELLLQMTD